MFYHDDSKINDYCNISYKWLILLIFTNKYASLLPVKIIILKKVLTDDYKHTIIGPYSLIDIATAHIN